jgi:hypothetical protein
MKNLRNKKFLDNAFTKDESIDNIDLILINDNKSNSNTNNNNKINNNTEIHN